MARLIAYDVLGKVVFELEIGKASSRACDWRLASLFAKVGLQARPGYWQGSLPTMCLARLVREREIAKVLCALRLAGSGNVRDS